MNEHEPPFELFRVLPSWDEAEAMGRQVIALAESFRTLRDLEEERRKRTETAERARKGVVTLKKPGVSIGFVAVLVTVLSLLPAAPAALAGSFYIGASVGESEFDLAYPAPTDKFSAEDTAFKGVFGYTFNQVLSVELNYMDFGSFSEQSGMLTLDADAESITAFAVGSFPIVPSFDLYGKAGFGSWSADVSVDDGNTVTTDSPDGTDFAYGFGANWDATDHLTLLAEWELVETDDLDRLRMISLGLRWRF